MGYLPLILILGIVGGCALMAYGLLEAIERDEDLDPRGPAEPARAVVLAAVPTALSRVSTPRAPAQLWLVRPHERGAGSGEADAGWLDGRILRLEERLDRLERACLRVEALASGSKRS